MSNSKKKVNIIPLGQNCMPRTILTRWKVKPRKLFGELTYPFDLAVFGIPEITKTLKTDFKEFFDNLEYNGKYWIKAPNCIYFSHDKDIKEEDKFKLLERYTKRIENFNKIILDSTPVIFVQILGDYEEIMPQYNELKRIRNSKPFKFIVIDTQNIIEKEFEFEEITVSKIPYPKSNYKENWWKKEYYQSQEGKAFEKQIADLCKAAILRF